MAADHPLHLCNLRDLWMVSLFSASSACSADPPSYRCPVWECVRVAGG